MSPAHEGIAKVFEDIKERASVRDLDVDAILRLASATADFHESMVEISGEAMKLRDDLVRQARASGATYRAIATAIGKSYQQVANIVHADEQQRLFDHWLSSPLDKVRVVRHNG